MSNVKKVASSDNSSDRKDPSVSAEPYVEEISKIQQAAGELDGSDITELEFKTVLRKLDYVLMPLMCVVVLLQFLDKTSLNYANLLGIQKDTHLKGQEYSWLGSMFYFGYLAASPVHGWCLQKFDLPKYTAFTILTWGTILGLHAACQNFGGLVACRFLLGWFEAGITPAFILLTGRFYKRSEQVTRTSIWFSMNGYAQILGGGISYGVQIKKPGPIAVWRELYLILAGITIAFGIVCFIFMPSSPATIRYLDERQRLIAVFRIKENKSGIHDTTYKRYQVVEAFKDVRIYLFFLGVCTANIANGGVTNFGSVIIKQFGYDTKQSALLGMVPGLSECVAIYVGAYVAYKTNSRAIPGVLCFMVAIAGGVMMIAIPPAQKVARMAGYALVFWYPCASPFYYSWLSSSVSGTSKRIAFNVFLQLGYSVGNLLGAQTYRVKDAPDYIPAKITLIAMFAASSLCLIAISAVHYYWNRKKTSAAAESGLSTKSVELGGGESENQEASAEDLSDLTDKERPTFRYPY
ncbi:MFS general substrate transporter [Violaceomyces palustris]|uniref:MFS general substrate transporter n=1 Tax=Violaceomyces palustris TaxID=1673888 RepID=A0ACD0NMD3_9BASI|nr:MFS general substrate transporter [Violaceomyces palustris]